MNKEKLKIAKKVSLITIVINVVLAVLKLIAGKLGNSNAMLADGVHTLSDVLTTVIVLIGIRIGAKKADENHPYGHERFESVFAKILSLVLIITGVAIGYDALKILRTGEFLEPKRIAVFAALASILTKELMYRYTLAAARNIRSTSMEADAWHHRSDALSSVGTLVGIIGARLGFSALDPIAGLIVSVLVIKVGVDLYLRSVSELVDESANTEVLAAIEDDILEVDGVLAINELRTRISGSGIFVDLSIAVDGNISVSQGHDIATEVHDKLEENDMVRHCMVHVEPYN